MGRFGKSKKFYTDVTIYDLMAEIKSAARKRSSSEIDQLLSGITAYAT